MANAFAHEHASWTVRQWLKMTFGIFAFPDRRTGHDAGHSGRKHLRRTQFPGTRTHDDESHGKSLVAGVKVLAPLRRPLS